jgi:hypothetical protein
MNALQALLLAAICASLVPFFGNSDSRTLAANTRATWPTEFRGRPLTRLPLSEREQAFLSGFPGSTARFTDGENDIVMRHVLSPTRRLHPAEDCYKGSGYEISESRIVRDSGDSQWHCFKAKRSDGTREVCEQLQDKDGRRWTDVSSWYWAATLGQSTGPWFAVTVARNDSGIEIGKFPRRTR